MVGGEDAARAALDEADRGRVAWSLDTDGATVALSVQGELAAPATRRDQVALAERVECPVLVIHGTKDRITPYADGKALAKITGGRLETVEGAGHLPHARKPVQVNLAIRDFIEEAPPRDPTVHRSDGRKRALYISSPIGLGHAQRDVAIARELRSLVDGLEIDWLAQDPVTRVLEAEGERIHPASEHLANESQHIESESAEHDLHCFQAWRRMDEILINNFMVFHDVVREDRYDLWVGDEAWELDYYLHENPREKRARYAWLTDFVGWLPMPDGGEHEAYLTADYNAEMVEHIAGHPELRDRAIFVGNPEDIVDERLGPQLPMIRDWTERNFEFAGYVTGFDPREPRRPRRAAPRPRLPARREGLRRQRRWLGRRRPPAAPRDRVLRGRKASGARAADDRRRRAAHRPRVAAAAGGAGGRRLRPQPLPPSGRMRPGGGPGRADDVDGADRERAAVPVLPAAPPLRAELARRSPARPLRRRPADGLRHGRRPT